MARILNYSRYPPPRLTLPELPHPLPPTLASLAVVIRPPPYFKMRSPVTGPSSPIPIQAGSPSPTSSHHTPTLAASPLELFTMVVPEPRYSFAKSKIRVLALENVHQSALDLFNSQTFSLDIVPKALPEPELIDRIKGVHILCIRSKTSVTKPVIEASTHLLTIGCFCIGTDQVHLSAAEAAGIPVFNAPFSNTRSVAELVLGEIICLSRKICDKSRDAHDGLWNKSAAGCAELRGKTLGIVGYGHIGSQLSILAEALGMKVIYYDVVSVLPIGNGIAVPTMDALLEAADFVSLHVPKAPTTNNLISRPQLEKMKPGSYLINASRGTVVDIEALSDALREGHLAGAAVDVFPSEPSKNGPGFESALRGLENVILTPHIGGSTAEAQRSIGVEVATALIKFVNLGSTVGSVNFPNLDMPIAPNCHRILNVHRNVPGVLGNINGIISETKSNVTSQLLGTSTEIGYIIVDVNKETSGETKAAISDLQTSITTRILY